MTSRVLSQQQLKIETEDDISVARRRLKDLAATRKFDSFAIAALTTVASELGRNIWVHAGKGVVTIEEIADGPRFGLRAEFKDTGPGIPDIERALSGGFSTARSLGLGLSGSRRLVDEFSLSSVVGQGTVVTITKWKRF
jgi:serine/threonine-protein kinase RsbT